MNRFAKIALALGLFFSAPAAQADDIGDLIQRSEMTAKIAAINPVKSYPGDKNAADYAAQVKCIATAVFHEARGESLTGRKAVVAVIFARMINRKQTACQVVYSPAQFSWVALGQVELTRRENKEAHLWEAVQHEVMNWSAGQFVSPVGNADHFAGADMTNKWIAQMIPTATYGAHKFMERR